jgi:sulfur-oxidizing protein SoxY
MTRQQKKHVASHASGQTTSHGEPSSAARATSVSRRDILLRARTGGLLMVFAPAALLPRAIAEDVIQIQPSSTVLPPAAPGSTQPSAEDTIRRLSRGAKPIDGKVVINVSEIAENGNIVPFSVTADSPMTDTDFVKSIHIVCSGNAQAHIGSFHFTALSGQAGVTSRLRLAKTQDLFVLVEHSSGQFNLAQRTIKVTIGGCGGT